MADQAPPIAGAGHDYLGRLNETVNPATGAVSVRISVPVPPARGITVPFTFGYDSNTAQHFVGGLGLTDNGAYLAQGGWSYMVPALSEMQESFQVANNQVIGTVDPVDPIVFVPCQISDDNCVAPPGTNGPGCTPFFCPGDYVPPETTVVPTPCTFYDHFNFFGTGGDVHDLGILSQNNSNTCVTPPEAPVTRLTGGDAIVLANAGFPNGPPPAVSVVDSQGTFYSFPNTDMAHAVHSRVSDNPNLESFGGFSMLPSFIEDRNGNIAVITDHGKGSFQITDTLGRTAISTSGFGTSGSTVTVAGLANPYTVNWQSVPINWLSLGNAQIIRPNVQTTPPFLCSGGNGNVSYAALTPRPLQGISQIQLPNNQSYQFQYDPTYGLLNKLIYPSGGYIRYVWGINRLANQVLVASSIAPPSPGPPTPCEVLYDVPAIVQRFVSYDGQTEVEEQDFSYATTWAHANGDLSNLGYQDELTDGIHLRAFCEWGHGKQVRACSRNSSRESGGTNDSVF
jgi:hypothetical protein